MIYRESRCGKMINKTVDYAQYDILPAGVCEFLGDEALSLTYVNTFFHTMLGYEERKDLPSAMKELVLQEDWEEMCNMAGFCPGNPAATLELEVRIKKRNGEMGWFMLRCKGDSERPSAILCICLDFTLRKDAIQGLYGQEETYRLIVWEHTKKMAARYELDTKILYLYEKSAEFFNRQELENMPETFITEGIVAEESKEDYRAFFKKMTDGIKMAETIVKMNLDQDRQVWLRHDYTLAEDGRSAVISMEDMTIAHEKEIEHERWKRSYESQLTGNVMNYRYNITRDTVEYIKGIMGGEIPKSARTSFTAAAGYVWEHFIYKEDQDIYKEMFSYANLMKRYCEGIKTLHCEFRRLNPEGNYFWVGSEIQLIQDPYSKDIIAFVALNDIDEKKKEEFQLQYRLENDDLTGVLNRSEAVKKVTKMFVKSEKRHNHGFVMVDIDNFKMLNDSYGHIVGDQVLKEIAYTLKSAGKTDDVIARLGGDEFVICMKNVGSSHALAKRLETLRKRVARWVNGDIEISASIGASMYPKDGTTFTTLYQKADIALYRAKAEGRNRVVLFEPEMEYNNKGDQL